MRNAFQGWLQRWRGSKRAVPFYVPDCSKGGLEHANPIAMRVSGVFQTVPCVLASAGENRGARRELLRRVCCYLFCLYIIIVLEHIEQ